MSSLLFSSPTFSSAGSSADPFPDLFALGPKGEIRPESEQHYPEEEPFISDGRTHKYRPAGAEGETRYMLIYVCTRVCMYVCMCMALYSSFSGRPCISR